jgi:hypothetical protein
MKLKIRVKGIIHDIVMATDTGVVPQPLMSFLKGLVKP